jgi:hypothetical protein
VVVNAIKNSKYTLKFGMKSKGSYLKRVFYSKRICNLTVKVVEQGWI